MVTIMIDTSGEKIAPSTDRGTTYGYGNCNGNSNDQMLRKKKNERTRNQTHDGEII